MKLSDVKYRKCDKCKRGYPLAHFLPKKEVTISVDDVEYEFIAHDNKLCKPCLDDIEELLYSGMS